MSTQQTRSGGGGGGGGRTQKKSNSAGGGGGNSNSNNDARAITHAAAVNKKADANKTEKPEKAQPKATTEQLRIAQITNSSTTEDPQIKEKVTLLLTMTQRSEEEVCCALNECDYDLEAAANFLIETLPQVRVNFTTRAYQSRLIHFFTNDYRAPLPSMRKSARIRLQMLLRMALAVMAIGQMEMLMPRTGVKNHVIVAPTVVDAAAPTVAAVSCESFTIPFSIIKDALLV